MRAAPGGSAVLERMASTHLATLGIAVLAAFALATPAAAETTLGSNLQDSYDTTFGGSGETVYQEAAPAETLVAPSAGAITSWSVRSADMNAQYELRVIRPAGGEFVASGTSAPQTVPDAEDKVRGPFVVSLPVKAGDRIALDVISGTGAPINSLLAPVADELNYVQDPFADGATKKAALSPPLGGSQELLLQATFTPAPVNLTPPTIAGEPRAGSPLTASEGSWENASSFAWQWLRCLEAKCQPISGATESSYTPVRADEGQQLRVDVTATGGGGQQVASSALTAGVKPGPPPTPTNTAVPTISGEARATEPLIGTAGNWAGGPTAFEYQWLRCASASGTGCAPISGATSLNYVPTREDVGSTLRLRVTATNGAGPTAAESAPTKIVQPEVIKAVLSVTPGSPCTGYPVQMDSTGSKTPDPPIVSYEYTYFQFPSIDAEIYAPAGPEPNFVNLTGADTTPKLISKSASANYIFTWDRLDGSAEFDEPSIPVGTPLRDPVVISLKVTDLSGASATVSTHALIFHPGRATGAAPSERCRLLTRPLGSVMRVPAKVGLVGHYVQASTRCVTAAPCAGSLAVFAGTLPLRSRLARSAKRRTVLLATLPFFSVPARHGATLRAKLTSVGRRLMNHRGSLDATVQLTTIAASGQEKVRSVHTTLRRR